MGGGVIAPFPPPLDVYALQLNFWDQSNKQSNVSSSLYSCALKLLSRLSKFTDWTELLILLVLSGVIFIYICIMSKIFLKSLLNRYIINYWLIIKCSTCSSFQSEDLYYFLFRDSSGFFIIPVDDDIVETQRTFEVNWSK